MEEQSVAKTPALLGAEERVFAITRTPNNTHPAMTVEAAAALSFSPLPLVVLSS
jgi:hypothetical protein